MTEQAQETLTKANALVDTLTDKGEGDTVNPVKSKPAKKSKPKSKAKVNLNMAPVYMASKGNALNHIVVIDGKEKPFTIGKAHNIDLTKLSAIPGSMAKILLAICKKLPDSLRLTYTSSHGGTIGLSLKEHASFKGLFGYHGLWKQKPLFMLNNSGMLKRYASDAVKHVETSKKPGFMVNMSKSSYAFFAYSNDDTKPVIDYLKNVLAID